MRSFRYISILICIGCLVGISSAQKPLSESDQGGLHKKMGEPYSTVMNVNEVSVRVQANSYSDKRKYSFGEWSIIYPKITVGVVYREGIVWGGMVSDSLPGLGRLRLGGYHHRHGSMQAGRILSKGVAEDPSGPGGRIWRIRRGWRIADLTRDAAEYHHIPMEEVSQDQIDAIRKLYRDDWDAWPWEAGAPFYDENGNGVMDEDEEPGLVYADQVIWYVANDLDSSPYNILYASPPMGIEMQVTMWAYNRPDVPYNQNRSRVHEALRSTIFKRIRLIFKGCSDTPDTARIDSMYIAQWTDPDIGTSTDDLVGCDTLLDLGYAYNSREIDEAHQKFGIVPPAFGYALLSGPIASVSEDTDISANQTEYDFGHLPMTAFTWWNRGSAAIEHWPNDHISGQRLYKMLRGYAPIDGPDVWYPFPPGMTPGPFPLAGDPVWERGHVDGEGNVYSFTEGDREFVLSSGPFSMALNDTQEVLIALVGGLGEDRLSSVFVMKSNAQVAITQAAYDFDIGFEDDSQPGDIPTFEDVELYKNYPNPFNSNTAIRFDLPDERKVSLSVYNILGQKIKVLVDDQKEPGLYYVSWDGLNMHNVRVPTGIYLYRLEAGEYVETKKMLLVE